MKLPVSRRYLPVIATFAVLLIVFIIGAVRYDDRGFASLYNIVNLFRGGAVVGIAAIGATFIIISGGIDLSVGSVIAFTTIFVATLVSPEFGPGWHPAVAIVLALAVGTAFGALQGAMIHFFELPPFLVTLAGLFFARGMAFVVHGQSLAISHPFYNDLQMASISLGTAFVPLTVVVLVACYAVAVCGAGLSRFGREVYAVGGDEQSARLMGVAIGRVKIGVYALGGLTAALAGVVATIDMGSGSPAEFIGYELEAIAAVVIGGTLLTGGVGLVAGSLLGTLILGLIRLIIDNEGTLSTWWTNISTGALLCLFILFQKGLVSVTGRRGGGDG